MEQSLSSKADSSSDTHICSYDSTEPQGSPLFSPWFATVFPKVRHCFPQGSPLFSPRFATVFPKVRHCFHHLPPLHFIQKETNTVHPLQHISDYKEYLYRGHRTLFPSGVRRPGREADDPYSSSEIKND